MARNLFISGLLGAAEGWADDQQRKEDYLFRLREQEAMQQRMREESNLFARGASAGGGGSSRAVVPSRSAEDIARDMDTIGSVSDESLRKNYGDMPQRVAPGNEQQWTDSEVEANKVAMSDKRRGSNAAIDALAEVTPDEERGPRDQPQWKDPSGNAVDQPTMVIDRSSPFVQEKIKELQEIRRIRYDGPNADEAAKAAKTYEETRALEAIRKRGDTDATRAALAAKGQGEFDSLNGGVGTHSKITGGQSLNKVGEAKAAEDYAQAGKHGAEAKAVPEKAKRDAAVEDRLVSAEERRIAAERRAEIKALESRLEKMRSKDPEKPAVEAELKALYQEQSAQRAQRGQASQSSAGRPWTTKNGTTITPR